MRKDAGAMGKAAGWRCPVPGRVTRPALTAELVRGNNPNPTEQEGTTKESLF